MSSKIWETYCNSYNISKISEKTQIRGSYRIPKSSQSSLTRGQILKEKQNDCIQNKSRIAKPRTGNESWQSTTRTWWRRQSRSNHSSHQKTSKNDTKNRSKQKNFPARKENAKAEIDKSQITCYGCFKLGHYKNERPLNKRKPNNF